MLLWVAIHTDTIQYIDIVHCIQVHSQYVYCKTQYGCKSVQGWIGHNTMHTYCTACTCMHEKLVNTAVHVCTVHVRVAAYIDLHKRALLFIQLPNHKKTIIKWNHESIVFWFHQDFESPRYIVHVTKLSEAAVKGGGGGDAILTNADLTPPPQSKLCPPDPNNEQFFSS